MPLTYTVKHRHLLADSEQEWGDQWAMNTMWSHSDMPIKAISENRHGKQAEYLDAMRREFDYAMEVEMPKADGEHSLPRANVTITELTSATTHQTGPRSTSRRSFR
jgi:hypothetical protein